MQGGVNSLGFLQPFCGLAEKMLWSTFWREILWRISLEILGQPPGKKSEKCTVNLRDFSGHLTYKSFADMQGGVNSLGFLQPFCGLAEKMLWSTFWREILWRISLEILGQPPGKKSEKCTVNLWDFSGHLP